MTEVDPNDTAGSDTFTSELRIFWRGLISYGRGAPCTDCVAIDQSSYPDLNAQNVKLSCACLFLLAALLAKSRPTWVEDQDILNYSD